MSSFDYCSRRRLSMETVKRSVATIATLITLFLIAACGSSVPTAPATTAPAAPASTETTTGTTAPASIGATAGTTAPASTGATAGTTAAAAGGVFDPDNEADSINYSQLATKLGTTPKPSKPYKIGGVVKFLGNQYWKLLAEGMQKKAQELGVT